MKRQLATHAKRPCPRLDPLAFRVLDVKPPMIPDPEIRDQRDDEAGEAVSVIIVPLHPAPKTLR